MPLPQSASGPNDRPVIRITLGSDGRIYCHDVPVELLEPLLEMCPCDEEVFRRLRLIGWQESTTP